MTPTDAGATAVSATSELLEPGLRERQKDATRQALAEHALALALSRGYRGFTIAELVAEVGVSRRTFSNYFASKAECVAAVAEAWLDDVIDALRQVPQTAPLPAVLQQVLVTVARDGVDRWGALLPLVEAEPELAAQLLAQDAAVVELLISEGAARSGLPGDDLRLNVFAKAAVTAGREAFSRWAARGRQGGEAGLAALLEQAFSVLNASVLSQPAASPPASITSHSHPTADAGAS